MRDGKLIWGDNVFGDAVETPIVEGGVMFAAVGYPRANDTTKGLRAFKIPLNAGAKLTPSVSYKTDCWRAARRTPWPSPRG